MSSDKDFSNTTPVPDTVFDELLSELTGNELKVLLYIIRRTYGFGKTSDAISLSQFREGITTREGKILDKGCGIGHNRTILVAIASLEAEKHITTHKSKTSAGDDAVTVYKPNFKVPHKEASQAHLDNGVVTSSNDGSLSEVTRVVTPSNDGRYPTSRRVVTSSNPQDTVLQVTGFQETALQETGQQDITDLPSFPLSKKDLQKQNEVRANEIWTLIETELKTTFSGVQRHTKQNQDGMNGLLESDETNERIIKALKGLDTWQRSHFTLSYFLGLIPGLNSGIVEPPKSNGKYPMNGSQRTEKPSMAAIAQQITPTPLVLQDASHPLPDAYKGRNGIEDCPLDSNPFNWFESSMGNLWRRGYYKNKAAQAAWDTTHAQQHQQGEQPEITNP